MIPARRLALAPWEVGLFVLAVLVGRLLALDAAQPGPSAWIDLRYAQNLAAGRGFVFTPGAPWEPTAGASAPGFVGLLAALRGVAGNVLSAARWSGIFADILSVFGMALLLGGRPLAARVCLLLFAVLPAFVLQAARADSGCLALCLALAAAGALKLSQHGLTGLWAGLCAFVRPELGLLAPSLALFARGRSQLRVVLPTVGAVLLFLVWIKSGFEPGLWLAPLARIELADDGFLERWSVLARSAMGGLPGLVLAPVALYGFYRAMQVQARGLLGLIAVGVGLVLAGTFTSIHADDGLLHVARGSWIACAGLGVAGIWRKKPAWRTAVAPLALSAATLVAGVLPTAPTPLPDQAALIEWARGTRARGASLYVRDGAALAYLADTRVFAAAGGGLPLGRNAEQRREVLRHFQPEYLLLEVAREGLALVYADDDLARGYYPVQRFNRSGETLRNPSLVGLPARAPEDLLLLRRGDFGLD